MATSAIPSQGVQFKRNAVLIGEITSINGPSESAKQIDVTSFDSTSREYIAGLRDGGEVSIDFNLIPGDTAQMGLRTDLAAGTAQPFTLTLTDDPATVVSFSAIVTNFSIKGGVDDRLVGSATLKISGDVTYTPGV